MKVEEGVWKKEVGENASAKDLGPYHRIEREVHAKKGKGILIVEREKRRSVGIHRGSVEERIHSIFQVAPNVTSTLCSKKGWHMENGTRLLTHKSVDDKQWISFTSHRRHTRWSRKEKGVHEAEPEVEIQ